MCYFALPVPAAAKKKAPVYDLHSHLQQTKRQDDLVSSPRSKGVHDRESSSDSNGLSLPIPRKKSDRVTGKGDEPKSRWPSRTMMTQEQEPAPNGRGGDWITTRRGGAAPKTERRKSIRSKLKKQGARFEKEDIRDAFDYDAPSSSK